MGVPQTRLPKFKNFNHSRKAREIFWVGKYKEKFLQNGALQNSNFLSWKREMVVHKFSTYLFEATCF